MLVANAFLKKSMSRSRRYLVSFCSVGCPVDSPWDEDACLGASLAASYHFIAVSSIRWRIISLLRSKSGIKHRLIPSQLNGSQTALRQQPAVSACSLHFMCKCFAWRYVCAPVACVTHEELWRVVNHCVGAGKLNLGLLNKYSYSLSHISCPTSIFRLLFLI